MPRLSGTSFRRGHVPMFLPYDAPRSAAMPPASIFTSTLIRPVITAPELLKVYFILTFHSAFCLVSMSRSISTRRSGRSKRALVVQTRPRDPVLTATRIFASATHVPQHNVAPSVTRSVRLVLTIDSVTSTATVTYADIANQDQLDYNTSGVRYGHLRASQFRAWLDTPMGLVNVPASTPFALYATEEVSNFVINDRPTAGSRLAAIGMRLPFVVRSTVAGTSSSVTLATFAVDQTIPAGMTLMITTDWTVELYS